MLENICAVNSRCRCAGKASDWCMKLAAVGGLLDRRILVGKAYLISQFVALTTSMCLRSFLCTHTK